MLRTAYDGWWGLYADGRLISVIRSNRPPLIWDFDVAIFSDEEYLVAPVIITPAP